MNNTALWIVLAALALGAGLLLWWGTSDRAYTELILEADVPADASSDELNATMAQLVSMLALRVETLGLPKASVVRQGDDRIELRLPLDVDLDQARRLLVRSGLMGIHRVLGEPGMTAISDREVVFEDLEGNPYLVEAGAIVTAEHVADADVEVDDLGAHTIALQFTQTGAERFAAAVGQLEAGDRLAAVLDGVVLTAPVVTESLIAVARDRGLLPDATITGTFTFEEARMLAALIRWGALPVPVALISERIVDPE